MVSVAEQFGNLRNTLGSILGIFTLLRWARTLFAKITGRPLPVDATALTPSDFASFEGRAAPPGAPGAAPRPSKKPFVAFMVLVFGLPYLMGKLIKALAKNQEDEERKRVAAGLGPDGQPLPQALDPSKLDFCRVKYDFVPEAGVEGVDLAVKAGDLVAVLSKSDPMGNPSEWWRCRARDGRMGYLPSPYLEGIQRNTQKQIASSPHQSPAGSRSGTMMTGSERTSSLVRDGMPAPSMAVKAPLSAAPKGKVGDISAESFQKSQFYS
jgi:peroxin-13